MMLFQFLLQLKIIILTLHQFLCQQSYINYQVHENAWQLNKEAQSPSKKIIV